MESIILILIYTHIAALCWGLTATFLFMEYKMWENKVLSSILAVVFTAIIGALWPLWLLAELFTSLRAKK